MEKDLIILKDGTELELESASSLGDIRILFADKNSLMDAWEKMTPENLQEVRIQNRSGIVAARYTEMVLGDPVLTVYRQGQEGFLAAFGIRSKSDLERLEERMASVEETTDVLTMELLSGGEGI